VPVYPFSLEIASHNGETDAYHQSMALNTACVREIDKAILDSNVELYRYDLKAAAKTVIGQYGFARTNWVLAGCIQQSHRSGQYSQANHDWAKGVPIPSDKHYFAFNTHPAILNGFVDTVRKTHMHEMAQTVGQYEKSHRVAPRNRLTYFDSDFSEFVPEENTSYQKMQVRYNEIMEKKAARAERKAVRYRQA